MMGTVSAAREKWKADAIALESADPTAPVRIFKFGVNDSTQGPVVFDETSARLVMAHFYSRGVDGMIDLEHLSLDDSSPHWDPDARGAYRLEIRRDEAHGAELWMVPNWSADAAARIKAKRQRFVSPYFEWRMTEDGSRRVVELHNVALVANPATHGAQPLIAASARTSRRRIPGLVRGATEGTMTMADSAGLTIETIPAWAELLGLGPDAAITDVMAALKAIVMAADGEPQPTADTPPEEPAAMAADGAPPAEDEPVGAAMAATARLMRLSGRGSFSQALDDVETWRASHLQLEASERRLASERAAMESTERRAIAGELVRLGAEIPALVWADPLAAAGTSALSARLLEEPIGSLRTRAAAWRAAKGAVTGVQIPAVGAGASALSALDADLCKRFGTDPKAIAALRARGV